MLLVRDLVNLRVRVTDFAPLGALGVIASRASFLIISFACGALLSHASLSCSGTSRCPGASERLGSLPLSIAAC
jgi:hypothetical protein